MALLSIAIVVDDKFNNGLTVGDIRQAIEARDDGQRVQIAVGNSEVPLVAPRTIRDGVDELVLEL